MHADRTLAAIDATLTATEAPAMTTPPTDRIPLRTELSTAGQLAQALEANRQLHVRLGRAESETQAMMRDRNAALDERDNARTAADFRAGVLRRHAAEAGAAGEVIAVVRDAQERIDRALATYDTRSEGTPDDGTAERDDCERLADAMERGESVRIDTRDRIWRPAPGGTWRHPGYGVLSEQTLGAFAAQRALLVWLDGQDDEQDETADAQPPGSGPARAQGTLTRCCAHPGCPRTAGPQERGWVRLRGLTALCPDHASPALPAWVLDLVQGLADYEDQHPRLYRRLDESTYEQWTCPGPLLDLVPSQVLAEAGRRGARCTPADEPDPAALDEHRPAVGAVLDRIRAGRTATLEQIERDAAQHQDAVLAGTVQDEMTPAYPAPSPISGEYHWGRSWGPTQDEATCPCPTAPCGYVVRTSEVTGCELHGPSQTMRGGHFAASCPANATREG
ncbi:hypothetical protein [Nakamurella sp.]|uniref:hypothetical protein n=1 Tax=Nakamurella sp. TaxID=1869182 RepID=UPI003B3B9765